MGAEVVRLSPREGSPRVCDVEVTHEKSEAKPAWKAGPAQVTTREYRDSWDRIFGEPRDVAPVNSRSN